MLFPNPEVTWSLIGLKMEPFYSTNCTAIIYNFSLLVPFYVQIKFWVALFSSLLGGCGSNMLTSTHVIP